MSSLRYLFGKKLRKLRRSRDLTQEQLAEAIAVSTEFISNMERGVNAPSFDTLERLAVALEVPVASLFTFTADDFI